MATADVNGSNQTCIEVIHDINFSSNSDVSFFVDFFYGVDLISLVSYDCVLWDCVDHLRCLKDPLVVLTCICEVQEVL